ncbi:hypothetical protein CRD36_11430 [Paremcibacter congregatus]|uniref:Secretin/TonB short N-terminal domain-containing protein n=2 Tax=Paremcibacter congregatus TaxID=2043170 RepID=A0A2G4YQ25_9PROT|nr:hypothetical protein CRD36_11430 [Paremcibacter congregatus]QDE28637.1 TonB-dependent receptor [Paremcibacter congregatus]
MSSPGRHSVCMVIRWVAVFSLGVLFMTPFADGSPSKEKEFHITDKKLSMALMSFALQAKCQIYFPKDLVGNVRMSRSLNGVFDVREALDMILADTGLGYKFTNDRTIIVIKNPNALETRKIRGEISPVSGSDHPMPPEQKITGETQTLAVLADADLSPQLEEILVTSAKRSQNLQQVPQSIQAITEMRLEKLEADDFRGYSRVIPSLSFLDRGPGQQKIVIRGITAGTSVTAGDEPGNRATVGIYIDEVPVAYNGFNPDLKLFDVDRVEVIRGPQGTLYGAGSMSGTIRILTKKPEINTLAAKLAGKFSATEQGDTNSHLNGMLNVPLLKDKMAVRLTAYDRNLGGYIDNIFLQKANVNTEKTKGGRIALRFQPREDLIWSAAILHQNTHLGGSASANINQGTGILQQIREVPEPYQDKFTIYSTSVNYEYDDVEVFSTLSLFDRRIIDTNDITHFLPMNGFVPVPFYIQNTSGIKNYSFETRLLSHKGEKFEGIIGYFHSDQKLEYQQFVPAYGFDAANGNLSEAYGRKDILFESQLTFDERQQAVFMEGSYDLTGKLTVTAGLRYFEYKQDYSIWSTGFLAGGYSDYETVVAKNGLNPKFHLMYQWGPDNLIYTQAVRGFRLGGANDFIPADLCGGDLSEIGLSEAPQEYESDHIWNYEIGTKNSLFNNRMRINAAVFYIDWSDIQSTRRLRSGFGFTENAGGAVSRGIEMESHFIPFDNLEITVGGSYTDAEFSQDVDNVDAKKGDDVPGVPKFSYSLSLDYSFALTSALEGGIFASYQHVGAIYRQVQKHPLEKSSAYDMGMVRFSVTSDHWEVSFFVENIWDERARLFVERGFENNTPIVNRPRTWGLSLSKTF